MTTLPPEIWAIILSPMDRRDILNMALVSRAFCDSARRILSESVVLDGEAGSGYREYIEHLRKHGLLPLTKKLVVKTVHLEEVPWLQMPNLLSFTLAPNDTNELQCPKDWMSKLNTFITTLAAHKLEEIAVLSEFPIKGRRLAIPNIKRVIWNAGVSPSHPFFSLCQTSLETITELTVTISDEPSEADTYTKLWKIRLPKLRLLNVGPGNAILLLQDYTSLEAAFTQFLLAHPTIDNLTLSTEYEPDFDDDADVYLPLDSSIITNTADAILPNLTSLQAHPQQIETFVDADAQFLRTLHTLALSEEPYSDPDDSVRDLLDSFELYNQRTGTPSGIRRLSLFLVSSDYISCALDSSEFKWMILRASQVFPALEVWEGTVPRLSVLKGCFSKLPCLKKLHCQSEHRIANVDDVQKLAEQCLSLETYRCLKSGREFQIIREGVEGRVRVWVSHEGELESAENGEGRESGDEDADEDEEFSDGEY